MISEENKIVLKTMLQNEQVLKMKQYRQHGNVSTYDHCINVTVVSLKIAEKLKLTEEQIKNIIMGAMLHDFYLYDWHDGRLRTEGIHGFSHPKVALSNAEKCFFLNKKQKNIIRSHMFPLTLFHVPLCKEAWIVSTVDTLCACAEYFGKAVSTRPYICGA